ncbi:MAG: alpha/beta hydrolase [Alphaproteobacteria bacterium]|nr:alpha/beta hydrolase [Alphaproteobacteria bacterium]
MTHFVFCHGFGFDIHFWEGMARYFSQEKCSFVDLGYFHTPTQKECLDHQRIIGIGHSIGLSKLLSMYSHFDCLIGLNGFVNFLGGDPVLYKKRQTELKAIRSGFLNDAEKTLRNFYVRCDVPELIKYNDFSNLDLDLILSDLQWLQKEYKLPEIPTLILSSDDDIVVPRSITSDNFREKPWVKQASIIDTGHALGFRKPGEVYEKMMSFVNDRTA